MFPSSSRPFLILFTFAVGCGSERAALAAPDWKTIEPVLSSKCYSCHGGEKTKGEIDLKALAADPKMDEHFELWDRVLDTVESGEMPPPKAEPLVPVEEEKITAWVTGSLDALAAANSGDPGPVTMRRLTNAEYLSLIHI